MYASLLAILLVAGPSPGRLAVLDLVPRTGVPVELAQTVSDLVVSAIRTHAAGRKVISQSDLKDLFGFQQSKVKLGCTDTRCLAEIGGAMGAEELISGTLAILGDSYVLTLRRLDVRRASALREGSVTRPRGNDAVLSSAAEELVSKLFEGEGEGAAPHPAPKAAAPAPLAQPAPPPADLVGPIAEKPLPPPRRSHVAALLCLGIGAALMVAAVVGTGEVAAFGSQKAQTANGQSIGIAQGYAAQTNATWGLALALAGYPLGASGLLAGAALW